MSCLGISMTRLRARQLIIGSATIGSLGTFALHVIMPSLPAIRSHFGLTSATTQLVVSLGLLAFAAGQLIVAPLSDRFGRRPVVLTGLALFCGGSVLGLASVDISMLIVGRVLQAIGSGAAMAVVRATIMDYFGAARFASAIAWSATAIVLVPLIAPTAGGFVVEWQGWRMVFVLCLLMGIAVFVYAWRGVRETHPTDTTLADSGAGRTSPFASYRELIAAPDYVFCVLYGSFMVASVYTFITGAPYFAIDGLGLSPSAYGRYFIVPAVATFFGFLFAARLTHRYGTVRMITAGLTLACASGACMLGLLALGIVHPLALFMPMALANFGNALSAPSAVGSAVAARPRIAGAASGLMGFTQLVLAAAATQIVASFPHQTAWPLACTVVACNVLALACFLKVRAALSAASAT